MKRTLFTVAVLSLFAACSTTPLPKPLSDEMVPQDPVTVAKFAEQAASAGQQPTAGQLRAAKAAHRALEVVVAGRSNAMTEVAAARLAGDKDFQPASTCKIVKVSETVFDIVC